jgi:histidinol-phosphatase
VPIWATLIGLEEAGEVTAGVIHNPVTGEMFSARRGGGAWRNGERIRASAVSELREATLLHAGLKLLREAGYWDGLVRLVDATDRQRGFGDYLGYTLVAEGKAEIYAECDLKAWDLAPCQVIVEEAGGRFTDFSGAPTIHSGSAFATNGRLHEAALALFART